MKARLTLLAAAAVLAGCAAPGLSSGPANLAPQTFAQLPPAANGAAQMTAAFKPQQFKDDFTTAIRALVQRKAKAGDKATVQPFEDAPEAGSDNVVDLTELLRKSLGGRKPAAAPEKPAAKAKPPAPRRKRA